MRESKVKLEDVILDAVVDENPEFKAEVTEKPVETGQDISDYMKQQPLKIRLSGHCVKDAASKHEKLRAYQKEKKLIKYNGRGIYSNAVITELNTKHNTNNAFGFDFDITLTCVRIAKPEEFQVKTRDPNGKDDAKSATKTRPKTKTGRQQLQKQSGKTTNKITTYKSEYDKQLAYQRQRQDEKYRQYDKDRLRDYNNYKAEQKSLWEKYNRYTKDRQKDWGK